MNLQSYSKAIAAGIVSLVIGELARYGFHPDAQAVTAAGVIVTGIVSYVIGHVAVYLAPANKAS